MNMQSGLPSNHQEANTSRTLKIMQIMLVPSECSAYCIQSFCIGHAQAVLAQHLRGLEFNTQNPRNQKRPRTLSAILFWFRFLWILSPELALTRRCQIMHCIWHGALMSFASFQLQHEQIIGLPWQPLRYGVPRMHPVAEPPVWQKMVMARPGVDSKYSLFQRKHTKQLIRWTLNYCVSHKLSIAL